MVEEIEATKQILFSGLNSGLINGAKHAVWECVAAAVNMVEQTDRTVADVKKKRSRNEFTFTGFIRGLDVSKAAIN